MVLDGPTLLLVCRLETLEAPIRVSGRCCACKALSRHWSDNNMRDSVVIGLKTAVGWSHVPCKGRKASEVRGSPEGGFCLPACVWGLQSLRAARTVTSLRPQLSGQEGEDPTPTGIQEACVKPVGPRSLPDRGCSGYSAGSDCGSRFVWREDRRSR